MLNGEKRVAEVEKGGDTGEDKRGRETVEYRENEAARDSFQRTQAILYYEVSPSILANPPLWPRGSPDDYGSLIPRALEMKPNFSATSTLSLRPPLALQPRFPSLSLCPVEKSKGVLWG